MERRVRHDCDQRSARNARGTRARLGRRQAVVASGFAGSRLHNWCDGDARRRKAARRAGRVFDSDRFQRQRRNLFRAVWRSKRGDVEVTARQKIHPFQYLMVGAALCLFYLLLLSISEFIGFGLAYLIAAVASTVLITWYCRFFLGGGVRTLMIGAGLAGVYTFLYITLRQQDYALLMGAIALFIVLAVVMYVTRKIGWYARDAG